MAQTFDFHNLSPAEIARHLRQPDGEIGQHIGTEMNKGNREISLNAYQLLTPRDGENLLEIGMGNGFFVEGLLKSAQNLHYTGADFSPTMIAEAQRINQHLIETRQAAFFQASIAELPFDENQFDAIVTTNTLYFWPDPLENARELKRVLKPGGRLLIAYRERAFIEQLSISPYGFAKYTRKEVEALLSQAGFTQVQTQIVPETREVEFDGVKHAVEGVFTSGSK